MSTSTPPPQLPEPPAGVEFKAALLLLSLVLLLVGSGAYLLYARGAFEPTQSLVLLADDSEGVVVGMDLTFSGFPIGRVQRIELGPEGTARIVINVARKDAHWLRETSVFTMERSLMGATRIRAFTGMLDAPLLPEGAERPVLKGDAMADIPRLVSSVRMLLDNLNNMTAADSALNLTVRQFETTARRLNSPEGAVGVMMGNPTDRERLLGTFDEARQALAELERVATRTQGLLDKTDQRVFGQAGLMDDTQAAMREVHALLVGARQSLQRVDQVLVQAQGIAENTHAATVDLDQLRAEVEASLRRVDGLVNDINRRWPFARDTEIKLP